MTEDEFIQSIDCSFPYADEARWRELIDLGASISPNAAFMVLHEICRAPIDVVIDPGTLSNMLDVWQVRFKHPLVEVVLPAAEAMLRHETITVQAALMAMRRVASYPGQYNALSIPYFACDDVNDKADVLYEEIIRSWSAPNQAMQPTGFAGG